MLNLVSRARRRLFHNELFSQGANAAIAVLFSVILLLLVGTQLLDSRWLLPITLVAAAVAVGRARRRRLSLYAAAQVVDRRLNLADTISTAVYFQQASAPAASADVRQCQMDRANQLSATVDLRRAVPYRWPRSIYLLAVMVLVAGSLFALRYGLMGRLDLAPPLARMFSQEFGLKERTEVAHNNKRKQQPPPGQQDDPGASANDPDQTQQMKPDTGTEDGTNSNADMSADKNDSSKGDGKKDGNQSGKSGEEREQEAQAESDPKSGDQAGKDAGKQDSKQQSGGKQESNNSSENSSLMNKAKDMLQNLLSSMKPPQNNSGNQQQNKDGNNQQSKQQQNKGEKNGQPQSSQKGEQSDGQQGEQGQDQQDQSQQPSGKNDSQQGNKQPGSGAGNQDGDKRIKQAEDVAAMGKITEILGKRSATVTGEATVEVQSTNQQLKTAYTQSGAQHGQSGGEINRDEIPVAMQPYVQEYFKQARKAAPATAPAPAKKQ